MATLWVDGLRFTFKPAMAAEKYDEWQHYKEVWNRDGGKKAVDVVAMRYRSAPPEQWLIEAKDFRTITSPPEPSNCAGLPHTVAEKVEDTMAGLKDAAAHASNPEEQRHAARAVAARATRVVLHLEANVGPYSTLFPRDFSAAKVLQKLKATRGAYRQESVGGQYLELDRPGAVDGFAKGTRSK